MKKISLKVKFLIPLTIVITLAVFTLNYLFNYLEKQTTQSEVESKIFAFRSLLDHHLKDEAKILKLLINKLQSNPQLQSAFLNKDREKLFRLSLPYFEEIEKKYDITHMYFIEPNNYCYLRTHKKEVYGDYINRNTLIDAKESQKNVTNVEIGSYGSLTYRSVTPWVINSKTVGFIELGIEFNVLLKSIEQGLNSELIFLYNKKEFNIADKSAPYLESTKAYLFNEMVNFVQLKKSSLIDNETIKNIIKNISAQHTNRKTKTIFLNKGEISYCCTLYFYKLSSRLTLPVLLIYKNPNYIFETNFKKFILIGSILLGLIIFFIFLKITGKIERSLKTREEELKESNKELEDFASIASHDLKAPLRAIDNLANWIEEDMEDVTETTKEQLALMKGRIAMMNKLLDSLLEYSRIGRTNEDAILVDVNKMLENIFYTVSQPKGFIINIAKDMPIFKTQHAPLYQVFQNLIVNALKHHDKKNGSISIKCITTGNHYTFYVEDNGPGIPAEYHDKIFQLFQTLKSKDETDGVGMGLAIIKKTVEKFGGNISISSKEGEGTTFIFTWPKQ